MRKNEFIKRATERHNGKYKYNIKTDIVSSHDYIEIICPIHGEFTQIVYAHLKGQGCPYCARNVKMNTDIFIERAKQTHGDKYDYSKVKYSTKREKVCIICPEHGEFWQLPSNHIRGSNCPKCALKYRKKPINRIENNICGDLNNKTRMFIEKARKIHHNKYYYSKSEYKGTYEKICIICPEHGEFWQSANNHLRGHGCPMCSGNISYTVEEYINNANIKHNFKYNYDLLNEFHDFKYETKIPIVCPEHGLFYQSAGNHLKGVKCPKCAGNKHLTTKEFIEKARKVHGNKYDYSKIEYKNYEEKVCIVCPIHGEFLQSPSSHLNGGGCPICNESRLENETSLFLDNNNIKYIRQKTFSWLRYKCKQFLDFYLPEYNIVIECQGEQHFKVVDFFKNSKDLKHIFILDENKNKQCKDNGIKVFYYTNEKFLLHNNVELKIYNKENTFFTLEDLLNKILTEEQN